MRDKSAREPSRSLYRYLETAFDSGEFVVRESGTACSAGVILHAVDASGKRVLLIPVSEEEFEGFVDDAAGTAVVLRKERYSSGQGSKLLCRPIRRRLQRSPSSRSGDGCLPGAARGSWMTRA